MKIGIGASKKIIIGKKKDADESGIGTRITGTARSLSIGRNRTLNCPLLGIAMSAMAMIGMTGLIGTTTMMIGDLMGRLEGERRFMIGWGADSVYTTDLVIVLSIFPGVRKNLKRWLMHEFPMSSYSAGMLIVIGWSQENIVVHRQGSHHFLHGVQKD